MTSVESPGTDREKFRAAVLRQRATQPVGPIDPRRITIALDARGLYGPEVDEACGVKEPTVDMWETGELTPTPEQLERLAALCGVTLHFFSRRHAPLAGVSLTICGRGSCEVVTPSYPADEYETSRKLVPLFKETLF